jgi:hypothetical protein
MWKHHLKLVVSGLALLAANAGLAGTPALTQRQLLPSAGLPAVSLRGPCLRSRRAYLRAHIRGAVRLDVDLRGAQLSCEGGPRIDGSGIRIGFEGRVGAGRRRVRMVFGIDGAREGWPGQELPTNLTVIFEGERQLFATQGDRNCTIDRLAQERIDEDRGATPHPVPPAARPRSYLVTAHGFCIAPANDLGGKRRIVVTTFDFAGRADFEPLPRQP